MTKRKKTSGVEKPEMGSVQETLLTNDALMRTLMEYLPDYVYVKDTAGRFVLCNASNAASLGAATPDEVVGKTDFDFFPLELAEQYRVDDQTVLQSGQPLINREELRLDEVGNNIWLLTTKVPLRDQQGQVTGLVGLSRDITVHKRLEEQLRQAQKMEAIGQMAGGIAHDFNNLLMVIKGYSEFLLYRFLEPRNPARKYIEHIDQTSQRATQLIRHLLAFSRKQELRPKVQTLDLNQIISDLDLLLRRIIGENVTLFVPSAAQPGLIKADPSQIEQIIINMIVNARDAMPHGGTITIETMAVTLGPADQDFEALPGDYMLLLVTDTGLGMDEQTQHRIFEPFFTTRSQSGGTGLGLATVYGIVKRAGGYIQVQSELGQGSVFKIYWPQVETTQFIPGKTIENVLPQGHEVVLLVEDEPDVRNLLHDYLDENGYTVLEAATGEEALAMARQHPASIDVLITEVVMPVMTGKDLAERLAVQQPQIRVLYLSGYPETDIAPHHLSDSDANYLQKPFALDVLGRKMRDILDAGEGNEKSSRR